MSGALFLPLVAAVLVEAVYLLAGTVRRARAIQRAACDTRAGLAGQED